ncbi:MAG: hypothetical protein V7637_3284 [Mycobacteriales bacterium]
MAGPLNSPSAENTGEPDTREQPSAAPPSPRPGGDQAPGGYQPAPSPSTAPPTGYPTAGQPAPFASAGQATGHPTGAQPTGYPTAGYPVAGQPVVGYAPGSAYPGQAATGGGAARLDPAMLRAMLATLIGSVLTLTWLWLPWVTVSVDSTFESVHVSTNGLHKLPQCFLVCAAPETSTVGVLLAVAAGVTAGVSVLWLVAREAAIARLVPFGPPIMLLAAIADAAWLYADAQDRAGSASGITVLPGIGAILAILTSAGAIAPAILAARRTHPPAPA